jgi:hypothetical protein
MEHGYHVGKVRLVIGNKQYVGIGKLLDDLTPFYLKLVEALEPSMRQCTHDPDQPFFQK